MKIAFFSEVPFVGKWDRNHTNSRTDVAWQIALDATHYNLMMRPQDIKERYDIGIFIIPKKNISALMQTGCIDALKSVCDKFVIMQEGPSWYFQDYTIDEQIWFIRMLVSCDMLLCHNEIDKRYYSGLLNHSNVNVMPSLIIEDSFPTNITPIEERDNTIIGGNFCSWYGGMDSYLVAREIGKPIFAPSMGRKVSGEEQLVINLPYYNLQEWIGQLSKFKYAIHLMRTYAAGTFSLNCSRLGIPCIGYNNLDTQRILHPNLSFNEGDLRLAKEAAQMLVNDSGFYETQVDLTRRLYWETYTEEIFKKKFYSYFGVSDDKSNTTLTQQ